MATSNCKLVNVVVSLSLIMMISSLQSILSIAAAAHSFNVIRCGAKGVGKTDSTKAFLRAWKEACGSVTAATMYVPKGRLLIKAAVLRGPCRNRITLQIDGTLVAPSNYRELGNSGYWLLFIKVNRLAVYGGTLDARESAFWACRRSGKNNCPVGARHAVHNAGVISGLTSINSQVTHLVINSCNNVLLRNVKVGAPDQSPNTDGIQVQSSTAVTITGATLGTGDDCISIGPANKNLLISNIKCCPSHGFSIGSLGKEEKEGVENVTLTNSVFMGSDNGVRIKSWARPSNGFVRNVLFENLIMKKVQNPIIIDQDYGPTNDRACPRQRSGVKISQVTYRNIRGTSATAEAVRFDCSASNPCTKIRMQDINLTYMNKPATSFCNNVAATATANTCLS